ncbi:hypothetical protein PHYSODRAFT_250016 [Phytophthora sojae]|uniref:Uncharacterized protein n=1 Tax=Phytophthora sojae (strain P6497) TaxID=1094619 RepID=G5AIP7_PHYSP|nr:hypothetical protein PHYSODRAFT_250016 [Phytophthora sojae]EGZ04573.1 hypothetical protein PHYSODRAFT_250016 [Phytophthora sojae]|eukprot:XP_009539948.1 hypothetical protein PHYSODRAFT_250016 [Phytophthora sojae]
MAHCQQQSLDGHGDTLEDSAVSSSGAGHAVLSAERPGEKEARHAAKIRERTRKRAAARKENQGAGAESSVEAATTASGGCEAAGAGVKKAAGAKEKKLKKAAGAKARKAVGGPLAEALQAAMAEAAADSMETAPAASSVAPCGSCSGAGAPATCHGTSKQVTVTSDYATTKMTWRVARINDRRSSPRGPEYRVLWLSRLLVNRRYYQRTWEPLQQLLDDGFANEVDLVDRWKESGVEKFWPKDEFGKRAIGADARGLCMFNALKRATELAGRPDIVTQVDIDTFVADELREPGVDLTGGPSWKVVLRFLRRLRDAGRDFIFKAIAKNNFTIAGRRGALGHAFVLSVQGKEGKVRRIYDLKEPKPVASAMDWITFVACIRPFIVFKKSR